MTDDQGMATYEIGKQVGIDEQGDALFDVVFERDGQLWRTVLTREDARGEASTEWESTVALCIGSAPEPERPFNPFRDLGVSDLDFL